MPFFRRKAQAESKSNRPAGKRSRRWFQFSIRTLLLFMGVAGVGLGFLVPWLREGAAEQAAVDLVKKRGGSVDYRGQNRYVPNANKYAAFYKRFSWYDQFRYHPNRICYFIDYSHLSLPVPGSPWTEKDAEVLLGLRGLDSLNIDCQLPPHIFRALMIDREVRWLMLGGDRVLDADLTSAAKATKSVYQLSLRGYLSDEGWQAIGRMNGLRNFGSYVTLFGAGGEMEVSRLLQHGGLEQIHLSSPAFSKIPIMRSSSGAFRDLKNPGVANDEDLQTPALTAPCEFLASLGELPELKGCVIRGFRLVGVPETANRTAAPRSLSLFVVNHAGLGDEQFAAFSPLLRYVERLDLNGNALRGEFIASLANWRRLKTLDLGNNPIDPRYFSDAGRLKQVQELIFQNQTLRAEDIAALAESPRLRSLHLLAIKMKNNDWSSLSALRHLRKLDLQDAQFGDDDLDVLAGLTQLREIKIHGAPVTEAGAERLHEMLPHTWIQYSGGDKYPYPRPKTE